MLHNHRAHQQATITSAFDDQLVRPCIVCIDQKAHDRVKIIKDILLTIQHALLVPVFTVLSATTQVCLCENPALFQPDF